MSHSAAIHRELEKQSAGKSTQVAGQKLKTGSGGRKPLCDWDRQVPMGATAGLYRLCLSSARFSSCGFQLRT